MTAATAVAAAVGVIDVDDGEEESRFCVFSNTNMAAEKGRKTDRQVAVAINICVRNFVTAAEGRRSMVARWL